MNKADIKKWFATTWLHVKRVALAAWTGVHLSAAFIWSGVKAAAIFFWGGLKTSAISIGRWLRKAAPVVGRSILWVMRAIWIWVKKTAPIVWDYAKRITFAIGRLIKRASIALYRKVKKAYADHPHLRVYTVVVVIVLVLGGVAIGVGQWQKLPPGETVAVTTSPDTSARGSTIVVGATDAIDIINPLYSIGDGENDAVSLIFEPLVQLDAAKKVSSRLAASWVYDETTHQLVFELTPDHTFRDGRVVNAADVVFTYQCLLSSSYDGPLQGRFDAITAVAQGSSPRQVVFTLADWVETPDFSLYTIGILKSDYYIVNFERVFEMSSLKQAPEGSGSFYLSNMQSDQLLLSQREGYGGSIKNVTIIKIASESKYRMLQRGELDIVANSWDTRMAERAKVLVGYQLTRFSSSVEDYFLVNPEPAADSIVQLPLQRLAVLMIAAGQKLDVAQRQALTNLSGKPITLYYYIGLNEETSQANRATAAGIAKLLNQAGLDVTVASSSWPQLAAMATTGRYDILLMPSTVNNRLPDQTNLLSVPVQPTDSAFIAKFKEEVYIVSNRLTQVTINPNGHPFAAMAGSWTDRIENIRILNSDGSYWEEVSP